jgi:predicted transcriptional regulator
VNNKKNNNIEQNLNEGSIVSDLNDSLDRSIHDASETINKLIENIESTIKDSEIGDETKELLKNFSKDLRESVELTSDILNDKVIDKNNFQEEE